MRVALLVAIVAVGALLAVCSVVEAHKSVKYHKPTTEETREAHHNMMRKRPDKEKEFSDAAFMKSKRTEFDSLDQKHKSHHRRWGPSYPNHVHVKNWHYPPPRYYKGTEIPHAIHDDHLHLFGLSKYQTL